MVKSSARSMGWIVGLLVCLAATVACESTSRVDEHFGDAVRANRLAMTANPDAGTQPSNGVTEMEGTTVEGTLDRYRSAQTRTPQSNMPTSILMQNAPRSR